MKYSKKIINDIKQHVNIVDLASEYFTVTKKNGYLGINGAAGDGGDFSSLIIYPKTNSFFRSSNRHGGDVISFVIETQIEGITSFNDAVKYLQGRIDPNFQVELTDKKNEKKYSEMSAAERGAKMKECHQKMIEGLTDEKTGKSVIDREYRNVMAYLIQERKIDPEIVRNGIRKGEIAQVTMYGYKSVAFISRELGLYSCISRRAITRNSTFKGDLKGCNYDVGWRVYPDNARTEGILPEARIYCFEGYIDMLSYKTLAKMHNKDVSKDIFIVCGSAYKYQCVINLANEYNRDVVICFDNDKAGIELGSVLEKELKKIKTADGEHCIRVTKEFSKAKDWNEDLQLLKNKTIKYEKKTSLGMGR